MFIRDPYWKTMRLGKRYRVAIVALSLSLVASWTLQRYLYGTRLNAVHAGQNLESTSDLVETLAHNVSQRATTADTAEFFRWYEFRGFEQNPNERNMVVKVIIGVWVMVQNALIALDKNELDPSFLRYFARNNIWTVQPVLRSILVTMGMPDFEEERQCLGTIPKLEIWYGSAPSGVDRCDRPLDMQPLGFRHSYKDQNGQWREYVMFCDAYYRTYRSYDDVKCTELGTDSTPIGFSNGIWSASMVTLHELLHWKALTKAAADGLDIRDQIITRPDNGEQTKCYDPFYSKALMDWNTKIPPTTNIDNYVSFVTEAFYTFLCPNKEPWKDPVDPKDVFPVSSEQ